MLCESRERAPQDTCGALAPTHPARSACEVTSRAPAVTVCPKHWERNTPIFWGRPSLGRKRADSGARDVRSLSASARPDGLAGAPHCLSLKLGFSGWGQSSDRAREALARMRGPRPCRV